MAESVASHLRSLNNDTPTFTTFVNSSDRMIYLFWLDYKGKLIRYGHLPPRRFMDMNTYVTHPWVARDAVTWYPLLLNGKPIFYPEIERGGQHFHDMNRERVDIHIPVFPLFRRCLEFVYLYFKKETIVWTDMPKDVKDVLLKMSPPTEFNDYRHFDSVIYGHLHEIDGAYDNDDAVDDDEDDNDDQDEEDGDNADDIEGDGDGNEVDNNGDGNENIENDDIDDEFHDLDIAEGGK